MAVLAKLRWYRDTGSCWGSYVTSMASVGAPRFFGKGQHRTEIIAGAAAAAAATAYKLHKEVVARHIGQERPRAICVLDANSRCMEVPGWNSCV